MDTLLPISRCMSYLKTVLLFGFKRFQGRLFWTQEEIGRVYTVYKNVAGFQGSHRFEISSKLARLLLIISPGLCPRFIFQVVQAFGFALRFVQTSFLKP